MAGQLFYPKLGADQRVRANELEAQVVNDTLAAAYEIIFLRDKLQIYLRKYGIEDGVADGA